jgi:DnaJ-class molecular chaperone
MDNPKRFKVTNKRYPGESVTCDSCDGCGSVSNSGYRLPWSWVERESKDPDTPGISTTLTKCKCAKCKGTGVIRYDQSEQYRTNKKRY